MKATRKSVLCVAGVCGLIPSLEAQDLPHTFEAATRARAGEVNENFEFVRSAAAVARGVADGALERADDAMGRIGDLSSDVQPLLDLVLPAGEFVGIGEPTPASRLHVAGDATVDVANGGRVVLGTVLDETAIIGTTPLGGRTNLSFVEDGIALDMAVGAGDVTEFRFFTDAGTGNPSEGTAFVGESLDSVRLVLNADTNNGDEGDHAQIFFRQDGGLTLAQLGFFGGTNTFSVATGSTSTPILIDSNGAGTTIAGNLSVTGNVSKGAGTFKIDHPLDPTGKFLYHSFVESPDMMNVYNGNVTTDASGFARVQLPDYFEALNREFRYQLTPIGKFARAIVLDEVSGNQFSIVTDEPDTKVSWQVTGVRKDAYAEAHRVEVEVEKTGDERGFYMHPEAYGLPVELGMAHPRAGKIADQR